VSEKEFLEQIKQHQGIIYKLVSVYATDAEEKKDLYQEILLQSWRSFNSFRGDSKFSTWLYRVSLNTILTLRRKQVPVDYYATLEPFHDVSSATAPSDRSLGLQAALRCLSETDRAIATLHLEGYEHAEIADVIGISNNHVAVKLHRIKQQLSNLLKTEL
jgi:RNA polymerase sigma-70 factor (ECF subfamily)